MVSIGKTAIAVGIGLLTIILLTGADCRADDKAAEQAVLNRLNEMEKAGESLDAEKLFSFVLENDKGSIAQDGKLLLTRTDALEATKQAFKGLQSVGYHFDRQNVVLLSPTVALATGDGESSATISDGRTFSSRFAQSVVLVLKDGEWKVVHAHRSLPRAR